VGVAAGVLLAPAVAPAAAQGPEPAQPSAPEPGAPQVVVAERDLRMNPAGVIAIRVGCFGTGGDICIGRLEASLAEAIRARSSKGGRIRTWAPFLLGRQGFSVRAEQAKVLRLQFFPRGGYLTRLAGTIPVKLTARYGSRSRRGLTSVKVINVYVPQKL
jgi:hypothetical protein